MKRVARWLLAAVLIGAPASAQDGSALPPGHPPVGATAPAPAAADDESAPVPDSVMPAPDLPGGTIEAKIVDEREQSLAGVAVRLGILRHTVAEGEARSAREGKTDASGTVRFIGLETGSDHSYRITVEKPPAHYASDPIVLTPERGQRALLHVYPVTQDVKRTMVGMRAIVVVEPRDDVFQFQVMYRVFNMGRITWVPEDVTLDLPPGWKGFNAQESMTDARVAADDERVQLLGTFSPGQHDISFSFQVPNEHEPNAEFALTLPPHVAEVRVIAEAARGMGLRVPGFASAEPSSTPSGQRVLVTGRRLQPGEPELDQVIVRLSGVPTPGPGRWIAVALALGAVVLGLGTALSRQQAGAQGRRHADIERARELLLTELVALEKARRADQIGPRTYEATRRALLDAIARLEKENPVERRAVKPTGLRTAAQR